MNKLVRVITRPGWASLNFSKLGHLVRNDHHIRKFVKIDNSIDSRIFFPYTYKYDGPAHLSLGGEEQFFEVVFTRALIGRKCQNFIKNSIFIKFKFEHTKLSGLHQGSLKCVRIKKIKLYESTRRKPA